MYGHVSGSDGKPAFLVEVCAYRGRDMIDKNHTDDKGRFSLEIAGAGPVTILFDTHPSLTTANDWQPSMLANISVDKYQQLDRTLSNVGSSWKMIPAPMRWGPICLSLSRRKAAKRNMPKSPPRGSAR
jgi:hypothetical protein